LFHDRTGSEKTPKSKKQVRLFFSGVFILTAANLLVKVTGLLFKIPMNYIVGDTGMGYYGSAYSVYTFLYMLSTSGLPVALSILVAELGAVGRYREVKRVFRTALLLFFLMGLTGGGCMLLFSGQIARWIGSAPSVYCIIAIAPTLFCICISSAYRGFFQGLQRMLPIAVSQVIEALCKLLLGIGGALYSIRMGYGIHITAAYAVAGISVGAFLGMVYLVAAKLFTREGEAIPGDLGDNDVQPMSRGAILRRFASVSVPITVSAAVMSLSGMVDTVLIQRLLTKSGMAQADATALYGNYTSLAVPMFNLPPVLIYPITCALVPLLTSARAEVDRKRTGNIVTSSLRGTVLLGIPCAFGMAVLSAPILRLFYKDVSAACAAPLLSLLAPASFFVCILAITNAILQACGRAGLPVISMGVGTAVKILSETVLIHLIGIRGAPLSTFLCYFTASLINFAFVVRYTGIRPNLNQILMKPLFGGIACGLAAYGGYRMLSPFFAEDFVTCCAIFVGAVVYGVVILLTKAVSPEELSVFFKWDKIKKLKQHKKRKNIDYERENKGKITERKYP